jgi:signal transduction protein with GAF and PtsI domain
MAGSARRRPIPGRAARQLLTEIGSRADDVRRLERGAGEVLLRSIVDATVTLFQAHAASIALFDPATERLVFRVAAGAQGQGVVGMSILPDQGLAGYVFSTGQALALSDVASDPRFGRSFAESTAYVPRSIVAVPLVDEDRTIGVLEVLDKLDSSAFSLRDVELAGVFARQAAIAISASRVERDTATLLTRVLRELAADGTDQAEPAVGAARDAAIAELVDAATAALREDDEGGLWRLVELLAQIRRADPGQIDLLVDLMTVIASHSERTIRRRRPAVRPASGGRPAARSNPTRETASDPIIDED